MLVMKKTIVISLALAALMLFTACVSGENIRNYNSGVEAYTAGDIIAAKDYFLAAGGYGNSKSYLSAIAEYERIYAEAVAMFDAHDYDAAENSFRSIEVYSDSAERVRAIEGFRTAYESALEAYENEDYVKAGELFAAASGYKDADDHARKIAVYERNYQAAVKSFEEGDYLDALNAFERIGVPYRDSEERIAELYRLFSEKGVTAKLFIKLYLKSSADEDYTVTVPTADVSGAAFAFRTSDDMLVTGSADDEGFITSISFWIEKEEAEKLGRERVRNIFAHCVHAMSAEETDFAEVESRLDRIFAGKENCGRYSFSLTKNASGVQVLTAERK